MKNVSELDVDDSYILKGIAICAMLCWHLFYCENSLGVRYGIASHTIGILGDVCVSVFLFVSGYGLSKSLRKNESDSIESYSEKEIFLFVIRRLFKFYSNFWFIFVLFVPVGIFFFDRPLSILSFVKNLAGLDYYNEAWWFNGLIVIFYWIFPCIYCAIRKTPIVALLFTFLLFEGSIFGVNFGLYLFIFVIGVCFPCYSNKINFVVSEYFSTIVVASIITFVGGWLLLLYIDTIYGYGSPCYRGIRLYNLFAIFVILPVALYIKNTAMRHIFSYLGRHSANIFWFHSFIYYYWFPHFFFQFKISIVPFILLIIICLIISEIVERVKLILRFDKMQKVVTNYINNIKI